MTSITAVYQSVPDVACKGLCQRVCGPIACSAIEADALRDNGINPPGVRGHPVHGPMTCSHLTDAGRCAIYEHRPMICRLFGAVEALRCPHGCLPTGGFITNERAVTLLRSLNDGRRPHMAAPL